MSQPIIDPYHFEGFMFPNMNNNNMMAALMPPPGSMPNMGMGAMNMGGGQW